MGIVLSAATLLGLVLTSAVAASPKGASAAARWPVTEAGAPSAAAFARPSASPSATDVVERQVPAYRPSIRREEPVPLALPTATTGATSSAPIAIAAPEPEPAPASLLVPLPLLTVDVWNAEERYFSAAGVTPEEIVSSAVANVPPDQTGADRSTMAYAGPIAWDHRPAYAQDPATGSCTMTGLTSSVAYQATIPQWTAPTSVAPELIAWWTVVLEHIREHESHHIEIYESYVADLPGRVVGQPCGAWDAIIGHWSSEIAEAHAAFDAAESHWHLPVYAGPRGG